MHNVNLKLLLTSSLLLTPSIANAGLFEGHQNYLSAGSEYYEWIETTDSRESNFVSEYGPRLKLELDSNNWYQKDEGRLSSISTALTLGYVSYHGGSQKYNIEDIKSKTVYVEYDINIGQGYRYALNEHNSVDLKGYLGAKYWLRWIPNHEEYAPTLDKEVELGLTEMYLDFYAKAGVAYNYEHNNNNFTVEAGVFRPLETIEYCNCSSEYLYPKPDWGQYIELTYMLNKKYFTKAYYEGLEYQESEVNDDNYLQPTSDYKRIGLEIGMNF